MFKTSPPKWEMHTSKRKTVKLIGKKKANKGIVIIL